MDLPPAARAAFVANKCRGDEALRRQLCAMLAEAGDESFRPSAPPSAPSPPAPSPAPVAAVLQEGPGSVIGPYRLLQSIGEGGFGTVFLAQQSEPVQRQVAMKIVKLGMDTAQVVARFEQERQALAVMDHPHIAKVLDAGSTATGRPYFVMELCRGEPLTDYCDKNKLPIDERLALFEQICHAVQHAHGKGIIHRDLKPGNVLVGSQDGTPHAKVIDFGIAKATSQKLTDRTLFTEAQQVVGTLQYMSPEQAEGSLDIDTRTDVYSLGVILYELLTGSTPFDRRTFRDAGLSEVQRLIREVEPHKPSTRISDSRELLATIASQRRTDEKRLPALVRGELDWIVMKAIEKDRTRRYATAIGLAADVARFRRGDAVEAAPPSASYRLRKFLRRYRGPVVAAALVFVALLAGIAGTLWGLFEAKEQEQLASQRADAETKQRQRADGERDRAVRYRNQALDALRATTGEDVEKLLGSKKEITPKERAYLEAIAQRWLAFSQKAGEDVESRELRAEGLGRVALLRGMFDRGEVARAGYEESLALWSRLHDEFPGEVRYERELVYWRSNLAVLLDNMGDEEAAFVENGKVRDQALRLVERFPDAAAYRFYAARAHSSIGKRLRSIRQRDAARAELQRASELEQQLVAAYPADLDYRKALANTRAEIALLLMESGERQQALAEYEATRDLQRELLKNSPDDLELRGALAGSTQNAATVLDELGQRDRARVAYRAAIDLLEPLAAEFPAVPRHQDELARTRSKLGHLLGEIGENDAAKVEFGDARSRQLQLVAAHPAMANYQEELARTDLHLGEFLAGLGEHDAAIEHFTAARDRFRHLVTAHAAVPAYEGPLADAHNQLGVLLAQLQRWTEAEAELVAGRDIATRLVAAAPGQDEHQESLGNLRSTLGLVYSQQGRADEAMIELEAARELRRGLATRAPQVPRFQVALGGSHCNIGNRLLDVDAAEALRCFDDAVAVLQPVVQVDARDEVARQFLRNSHMGRGRANVTLGRWAAVAADWDACVSLSAVPAERKWFVEQRPVARVRGGEIEQALAEAEALAGQAKEATGRLAAARVFALAAAAVTPEQRQQHCDRAMALLQEAVQAGFRGRAKLQDDADFAPLRDREDFRRLVGSQQ